MATKKTTADERPKLQSSHKRSAGAAKPSRGAGSSSASGAEGRPRGAKVTNRARTAAPAAPTAAKKRAARELAKGVTKAAARPAVQKVAPRGGPRSRRDGAVPSDSLASDSARTMAIDIATAALDKKAVGLEVLDVAGRVDYADYVVLMSGRSDRQVAALASGIEEALRKKGKKPLSVEGLPHATWVLMDFGDVVVHVFQEEARGTYDLEGLWMDARRIPVASAAAAAVD